MIQCRLALIAALLAAVPGLALAGPVGARELAVAAPERGTELRAMVWYPAGAGGADAMVGGNAVFQGTPARLGARLAEGRFPLVLLSHGGFRAAPNAASWLAAALAAKEFVVALVNPPPQPPGPARAAAAEEPWLRPADLSATLAALERVPELAGGIAADKVAAVGMFLGGQAVLALAGARIDAAAYAGSCDGAAGLDCGWFAAGGVDLHRVDAARLGRSNRDARVRAVVAVDPELGGVLDAGSLGAIGIPVVLMNAGPPGTIAPGFDAAGLAVRIPGARYATIPEAGAFSSFAECTPKGPAILEEEGGETGLCAEPSGRRRADIHARMAAAIAAALRQALP